MLINKSYKEKFVAFFCPPSPLQFGARDLGFAFLSSGGGEGGPVLRFSGFLRVVSLRGVTLVN